jgi:hypothetical protein
MIRFTELWADNVHVFGAAWTAQHYRRRGMELWEALFWLRNAPRQTRW